jgi:hypothetical protein
MRDRLRIPSKTLATALALAAMVSLVQAQGLYRIVAPDGRVTYSDHPPATGGQSARVDLMRVPASTAQGAAGQAAPSDTDATTALPGGRTASNAGSKSSDATIEAAIIGVLGAEDAVRRTETICVSTQPSAARRYAAAVDDWARRNARPVLVARRVLSRENDARRRERIEAGVRDSNAQRFEALAAAAEASRVAWCDRSVAEIAAGRMDIHDKPNLAGPLAALPIR